MKHGKLYISSPGWMLCCHLCRTCAGGRSACPTFLNAFSEEELKNVSGGQWVGYYPGFNCPDCGAVLRDDCFAHSSGMYRSACTGCGNTFWYKWIG